MLSDKNATFPFHIIPKHLSVSHFLRSEFLRKLSKLTDSQGETPEVLPWLMHPSILRFIVFPLIMLIISSYMDLHKCNKVILYISHFSLAARSLLFILNYPNWKYTQKNKNILSLLYWTEISRVCNLSSSFYSEQVRCFLALNNCCRTFV